MERGATRQFDQHSQRLAELGMVAMTAECRIKNKHGFFNYGRDGGKDYQSTMEKTEAFLKKLGWIR